MKASENITKYIIVAILSILIISTCIYQRKRELKKHAIITIAKNVNWEADPEGSTSTYDVYYNRTAYKVNTSGDYRLIIGKYYFVKILPKKDIEIIETLGAVPDCILHQSLPPKGWKEIPKCE